MAAIEKLIGQTIPRAEGAEASGPSEATEAPVRDGKHVREPRRRNGNREANFGTPREGSGEGRKPRRERGPRRSGGGDRNSSQPQPEAPAAFTPPVAPPPSRTPSIGRAEAPRAPREAASEPADHSHLPAFLLRPVRARV
jgi:hypothetical protein